MASPYRKPRFRPSAIAAHPGIREQSALERDDLNLSRRLLDLHRAMTLPELWKSIRDLLVSSLQCHSVSLYLNYLDYGERFRVLHHQNAPGTHLPWKKRREISPAHEFLCHHAGRKIFSTRDLIAGPHHLERTDYFKNVMRAEGWQSHLCLAFWKENEPLAIVAVRRTSSQGDFPADDYRLLESLYDHFAVGVERIERQHGDRIAQSCLMHSLSLIPSGLLVLDERLNPILKNQAALDACLSWNHGEGSRYDASKCFAVPEPVAEACRNLMRKPGPANAASPAPVHLPHPGGEGSASIRLMRPKGYCLGRPYFLVQFAGAPVSTGMPGDSLRCQPLTCREREVALAVAEGLSNAEIAEKLGKSEITVKTQLSSVFSKLGLKRRSQLALLMR